MENQVNSFGANEGILSLCLGYLAILVNHSRIIIFSCIAVMLLTWIFLFCKPNEYTATTRILPPQQNLTLSGQLMDSLGGGGKSITNVGNSSGMGSIAASVLGFKSPGDLYVGMMTGETIYDRIIDRFNLIKVYKVKSIDKARKLLNKYAVIGVNRKDGIISIKVTAFSPAQAAEMANAFVEELNRLLRGLTVQEAKGRLAFLEEERLRASQNLAKAEEALRCFSEKNSVLQIDTQTKGVLEYIAKIRAEIDAKEVNLQVLRQQATPLNPDMVRLETEIKGLKEKLRTAESEQDNYLTNICMPTGKTPGLALEYIRLYREQKFQEGLYQLYIRLAEVARLDIVRNAEIIYVIDVAKPPINRSNQRLSRSIANGCWVFFGMVAFFLAKNRLSSLSLSHNNKQRLEFITQCFMEQWNVLAKVINIFIRNKKLFNK